ncbi:F0F1 ATP synthase subunit B [Propioniciclava sp. MC1595]|uniref:F0F1 ATP synthase subunit B n=1 Tax=unclassified Propioniciclava TaxID=2642922 RepID=UPI0015FF12A6|nr:MULTISPECIES: F0F1 ATP synthase subunit B [unclassified Propioniciclava]MBB1495293.1 F0F1 ATP synthase subunit B [Propioniciclava sp. MC1595]MBB1500761.1 F0F1 ATP synthase subunit B [Propioniciclava sp. MC1683]NLE16924.1 F0F1 ATP synthase subunit B [Propioniciclava sp.]QTE24753.1 F0F1 ATP synthase subunit B [Propioniciclava sp. MC1595]
MLPLAGESPLGPLLPEHIEELFVGLILFAIILAVMWKVVVPMFEKTYAERTAAIQGGIQKAEAAQAEAAAALEEYKAQLATAREEASRIREEAKTQGAAIVADMRQQATEESSRLLANAKAQIEAERAAAVSSLRTEIGGLATTLAGRIVGESLDDDARARRTVDRFIADLESQPVEQA